MIRDLLQKWAELEPDRCELHVGSAQLLKVFPHPWVINFSAIEIELSLYDVPTLLIAVMNAIVNRGGCYGLENAKDPDQQTYARIANPQSGTYAAASDENCAIALLKAYLQWLEVEVKAPP